jgi:putative DNA primase/helicase
MSALLAQSKADAADLIAKLIKECSEGASDREKEAVSLAGLWVLDEEEVRGGFAEARKLAKLAREITTRLDAAIAVRQGGIKRRKLKPDPKPKSLALKAGPPEIEAALKVSGETDAKAAPFFYPATQPKVDNPASAPSALFGKEVPARHDGPPILSRNVPMDAARKFSDKFCWRGDCLATYFYQGDFYQWNVSHYARIDEGAVLGEIYAFLDGAKVRNGNGEDVRYILRARDAEEILKCLKNGLILPSKLTEPYWLDRKEPAPSIIAFRNRLVDYETGEIFEPTPKLWVTHAVDFEFDPNAKAPRFEQFLEEIQAGDQEAQQCLLEQLGYGMTNETKFDKAALWYGVKRSGKSTLALIQQKLVGEKCFAALDIHNITKTENSAQILIGRKVGVFADVRMRPAKWYGGNYDPGGLDYKVAQLILNVTGRDAVSLGRKYKDHWEGRLAIKFILISNDVPNLGDTSNVLPSRFIKVHFRKTFANVEDVDLPRHLCAELPGIANLCLAAYRRLVARGKFIQPRSSSELEQRVLARISPLAEFMQDNWVKDDQAEGPTCEAFHNVFVQWCMTTGHAQLARSYPRQKLGRAIADLDEWSWLKSGGRTAESGRKRRYPGIRRKTEDE